MDYHKIDQDKLSIQVIILERYVRENKIEDFSVLSFLFDLKELAPNLKVTYIFRRLEKEYRKEENMSKVEFFYMRSLKVFSTARKYIKTGEDSELDEIIESINDTIVSNYEEAYNLFKMEFDV